MSVIPRRWTSSLLAVWFAVFTAAPQFVHHCPEHSAGAAGRAVAEQPASHHAHGDHSPSAPDNGSGEQCCCPGPACGATALAAAPPVSGLGAAPLGTADSHGIAAELAPRARPPHVLPFATAPPSALSA